MKDRVLSFINKNRYVSLISFLILIINLIMYLRDVKMMHLDHWAQYIQPPFLYHDFFRSVLYFHGNPPGSSIINYLATIIFLGNRYAFFEVVLPIFHCICFYLFYQVLVIKKIDYSKIIAAVLFLNPVIFVYFKLPFYCTFIFISSCFLLYVLISKDISDNKKLLYTAIILSFNCFLRSSWHIIIVFIFLIPFLLKANNRYRIISLLIVMVPLLVYVKNYILFDKFISSSGGPMNISRAHIPWECDCKTISKLAPYSLPKDYQSYFNNNNLQQKYKDIPILNQQDNNNVLYFAASEMYMKDLENCFNIEWSLKQVRQGVFYFYRSPANYLYLKKRIGGILEDNIYFCYDIFNINENFDTDLNPLSGIETYLKNLSPYTFIYIFVIFYFIINIKALERNERYLFLLLILFSGIYITTDFYESNRMRFEIEPFYYFFSVLAFNSILNKKNLQKK